MLNGIPNFNHVNLEFRSTVEWIINLIVLLISDFSSASFRQNNLNDQISLIMFTEFFLEKRFLRK